MPPAIDGIPYPGADNFTSTVSSVATAPATTSVLPSDSTIAEASSATLTMSSVASAVPESTSLSTSSSVSSGASQVEPSKEAASQVAPALPVLSTPIPQATQPESATTLATDAVPSKTSNAGAIGTRVPDSSVAPVSSSTTAAPVEETQAAPQTSGTAPEPTASVISNPPSVCPPVMDLSEVLQYLRDLKQELECVKSAVVTIKTELECVKSDLVELKNEVAAGNTHQQ